VRRVFGGATLVILGIAAFIEAGSHAPGYGCPIGRGVCRERELVHTGLSHTVYDLLRIGAWGLVILGGLLVVVGLIDDWRRVPA
jgi:hypothetical protein